MIFYLYVGQEGIASFLSIANVWFYNDGKTLYYPPSFLFLQYIKVNTMTPFQNVKQWYGKK